MNIKRPIILILCYIFKSTFSVNLTISKPKSNESNDDGNAKNLPNDGNRTTTTIKTTERIYNVNSENIWNTWKRDDNTIRYLANILLWIKFRMMLFFFYFLCVTGCIFIGCNALKHTSGSILHHIHFFKIFNFI